MEVMELGMVSDVRPVQKLNACSSMQTTELGMTIEVKVVQFENALAPMEVTVLGITVFLQPVVSSLVLVLMMALQLFRESYTVFPASTMIRSSPVQ